MGKYDFDTIIDRYGTFSTQWDFVKDRFGEEDLLPFTISDMDFKSPQGVSDILTEVANRGVFGYTRWNHAPFKDSIVNWFKKRYRVTVDSEIIVYSPSVIFSLAKLIEQFSPRHGKIVTFSPCYDAFINTVKANERELIQIDISEGMNLLELENIFKNENPDVFLLCNPQNPLGIAWSDEQMNDFVQLCNNYQVAFISDEIHMDVVRKGVQVNSLAKYFEQLHVDSAIITSASKAFNIPALGCSHALIPDKNNREEFLYTLKQKNALSSVPYLGMLATMECYNNQEEWIDELNEYIEGNFNYVKDFLKTRLNYDYTIPNATYLAWIDIRPLEANMDDLQNEMIKNQKLAIMDGSVYGSGGKNHLRLNLGAPRAKIEDGLNRMANAIEEIKK